MIVTGYLNPGKHQVDKIATDLLYTFTGKCALDLCTEKVYFKGLIPNINLEEDTFYYGDGTIVTPDHVMARHKGLITRFIVSNIYLVVHVTNTVVCTKETSIYEAFPIRLDNGHHILIGTKPNMLCENHLYFAIVHLPTKNSNEIHKVLFCEPLNNLPNLLSMIRTILLKSHYEFSFRSNKQLSLLTPRNGITYITIKDMAYINELPVGYQCSLCSVPSNEEYCAVCSHHLPKSLVPIHCYLVKNGTKFLYTNTKRSLPNEQQVLLCHLKGVNLYEYIIDYNSQFTIK